MRTKNERNAHRIFYIGFGVVCLHLAALGLVQLGAPQIKPKVVLQIMPQAMQITTVMPTFLVQMAPQPLPVNKSPSPKAELVPSTERKLTKTRQSVKPITLKTRALTPRPLATSPSPAEAIKTTIPGLGPEVALSSNPVPQSASRPTSVGKEAVSTQTDTALASAPASVELPSSDAAYLNNPAPTYPAISQRLGEQGKVVIRVLITAEGKARQAEINQSSGFDRLNQAALRAVMGWRYVPGQRAGVPQDMWFNVPINFTLN